MKYPVALLTTALALLFVSSSAQSNYYPTKVGSKWTYSSGETQEYAREETQFGTKVMVLQRKFDGKVSSEDYLTIGVNGIALLGTKSLDTNQLTRYKPPIVVYPKSPLKIGTQWQSTSDAGGGVKFTISNEVIGTAGIKVKAGRYNAFIVRSTAYQADGSTSTNDLYFVPSVGTVRYVYEDGSTIDLISR
jgi:hypothetical protein